MRRSVEIAVGVISVAYAINFGVDEGIKTVNAAGPCGTPTPVAGKSTCESGNQSGIIINNTNSVITRPSSADEGININQKALNNFIEEGIRLREEARKEFLTPVSSPRPAVLPTPIVPASVGGTSVSEARLPWEPGYPWGVALPWAGVGLAAGEIVRRVGRRIHLPHHHPHVHTP